MPKAVWIVAVVFLLLCLFLPSMMNDVFTVVIRTVQELWEQR